MCEYCHEPLILCDKAYESLLKLLSTKKDNSCLDTVTIPKQQYKEMLKKIKQYDNQHYLIMQNKTRF